MKPMTSVWGRAAALACAGSLLTAFGTFAQNLRYDQHREVRVPDEATLRLGPFFSNWRFSVSSGYRWIQTSGADTEFIFAGSRGGINKDGSDFPVILSLATRNYLIINPHTDLDVSVGIRYAYFPNETEDNRLYLFLPDEGLTASISTRWSPAPVLRITIADDFRWGTDYLDSRGLEDRYGGRPFEYISNRISLTGDLLLAERHNLGFGGYRLDHWALRDGYEDQTYVTHGGNLLYEHRPRAYLVVGAGANIAYTTYPQTNRADVLLQTYGLNAVMAVTERTQIGGHVGYAIAEYGGAGDDEWGRIGMTVYGGRIRTALTPTLSHGLLADRGLARGYDTAVVRLDRLRYAIDWEPEGWKTKAYTEWRAVRPSREVRNDYHDWRTGLNVTVPVLPFLDLLGSAYYAVRGNDAVVEVPGDPEQSADYTTWGVRLGTAMRLTDRLSLLVYGDHVERTSANERLAYTRDVFAAMLTYAVDL